MESEPKSPPAGGKRARADPARRNHFNEIGVRGRKTGVTIPANVRTDADGFDNVEDFFHYDDEEEIENPKAISKEFTNGNGKTNEEMPQEKGIALHDEGAKENQPQESNTDLEKEDSFRLTAVRKTRKKNFASENFGNSSPDPSTVNKILNFSSTASPDMDPDKSQTIPVNFNDPDLNSSRSLAASGTAQTGKQRASSNASVGGTTIRRKSILSINKYQKRASMGGTKIGREDDSVAASEEEEGVTEYESYEEAEMNENDLFLGDTSIFINSAALEEADDSLLVEEESDNNHAVNKSVYLEDLPRPKKVQQLWQAPVFETELTDEEEDESDEAGEGLEEEEDEEGEEEAVEEEEGEEEEEDDEDEDEHEEEGEEEEDEEEEIEHQGEAPGDESVYGDESMITDGAENLSRVDVLDTEEDGDDTEEEEEGETEESGEENDDEVVAEEEEVEESPKKRQKTSSEHHKRQPQPKNTLIPIISKKNASSGKQPAKTPKAVEKTKAVQQEAVHSRTPIPQLKKRPYPTETSDKGELSEGNTPGDREETRDKSLSLKSKNRNRSTKTTSPKRKKPAAKKTQPESVQESSMNRPKNLGYEGDNLTKVPNSPPKEANNLVTNDAGDYLAYGLEEDEVEPQQEEIRSDAKPAKPGKKIIAAKLNSSKGRKGKEPASEYVRAAEEERQDQSNEHVLEHAHGSSKQDDFQPQGDFQQDEFQQDDFQQDDFQQEDPQASGSAKPVDSIEKEGVPVGRKGKPLVSKQKGASSSNSKKTSTVSKGKKAQQVETNVAEDAPSIRRSARTIVKPLDFWKGEKKKLLAHGNRTEVIKVESDDDSNTGAARRKANSRKKNQQSQDRYRGYAEIQESVPQGLVMDVATQKEKKQAIAITGDMLKPRPVNNQNFQFQKTFSEGTFMTCGILALPKGTEKPNRNSDYSSMVFHVIYGCVQATVHKSSFTIRTGGHFQVPRGNQYRIKNVSHQETRLFFCQARENTKEAAGT